jgi:hypothetical protein
MAWGGFQNGRIPTSAMVEFEGTGKYLQADAASSLTRLFDATQKATGARPYIAAWQDLNRDLAEQITLLGQNYTAVTSGSYAFIWNGKKWRKTGPITCAMPGTSNHGWARAADISFPTPASRSWFRAHCGEYFWTNAGDAFGEDWHKEYHGPITTTAGTGTRIEDDMTPEQDARLRDIQNKLSIVGADYGIPSVIQQNTNTIINKLESGKGYDWLVAIANQGNAILASLGQIDKIFLSSEQIDQLANALKEGLGAEVANTLATRLKD